MEKWVLKNNSSDFSGMAASLGISEEMAKILVYRGVDTPEKIERYLGANMEQLYSPAIMQDMDKAACIIVSKINENKKIMIVGDYDVDGIMSTYILYDALKNLGATVDYIIPDRITDGFGINESIIDRAYNLSCDTILTCDNGIAAISQVAHAKKLGMTVIVTDHHDVVFKQDGDNKEYILPDADAVVNPHRPKSEYPFKDICGAAVAYKLVIHLYEKMGGSKAAGLATDKYVQYAGIATVCDIMPLFDENRVMVKECLSKLSDTDNIGLRELIRVSGAKKDENSVLDAYHIGFIIGPCLNAAGRLKTADYAVKLLCSTDETQASKYAVMLVGLNEERKQMTESGTNRIIEEIDTGDMKNDKVLVAYAKGCHESIAGIIAGRLKERYNRPAIVITDGGADCKGSGRSIEAYNMYEELVGVGDLFLKFGGHPMAAGLSLIKDNIPLLRKKLNDNCALTDEDLVKKTVIDVVMNPGRITTDFVRQLDLLEPFGNGNEKPVFAASRVRILKAQTVGKAKKFLKFEMESEGAIFGCIYFGDSEEFDKEITDKYGESVLRSIYDGMADNIAVSILYYPKINEFRNNISVEIIIKSIKY